MPLPNPAGLCRGARRVGNGIGSSRSLFFSPRALLPATVAKLRADGVRSIVIVPFASSDPLLGASAYTAGRLAHAP